MSQKISANELRTACIARRVYRSPTLLKGPKLDAIAAGKVSVDCWVARAAFGESDFRWMIFRAWLLEDAPASLRRSYLRHGERVGGVVLGSRHVRGAPAHEAAEEAARLRVERLELHVLHAPAAVELLHDQLRVEEELDLLRTELPGEGEGAHGPGVLGDVVRLGPEVVGDRGDRARRIGDCVHGAPS